MHSSQIKENYCLKKDFLDLAFKDTSFNKHLLNNNLKKKAKNYETKA